MVFFRSLIICTGGFDFVSEVAEVVGFIIKGYRGGPFFVFLMPANTFVLRGLAPIAAIFERAAFYIAAVLGEGAQPKVPLSII